MSQPARALVPWLAGVALVVIVMGTLGANLHADVSGPAVWGALLAGGAVLPALLPLPTQVALPLSGVLVGLYFTAGYADGPVFLAVPALALVHASRVAPRRWAVPALLAVVAVVAGLWLRHVLHNADRAPSLWQAVGVTALVAAAGAAGAAGRSRRAAAAERARSVAGEERLRMAADLHDGVGHGLAVIAMQAGAALHVLDRDTEAARASLEAIRSTSKESLDLLRTQLARLSDPADAPRTPVPGPADLRALVARVRAGGLAVGLDAPDDLDDLPDDVGRAVYAVVQEGLTNVLRHAAASSAAVSVRRSPSGVVVTVEDDGHGPAADSAGGGLGLVGMRSRVEALGGRLEAGPRGGTAGFRVRATMPLTAGVTR
ncbi:Signal transduction histidine kinase [Nocardioides terrae]|uniref:histidine kinase n=1 Tax=Nocardioides terrae TaxID=574651 RepID=A0A1I1LR62_9ACTN|nr:histidine kinase [Nocardioides terrae]SFC71940.1 Signal transduction histidine kinase [Nocardioides terrae]